MTRALAALLIAAAILLSASGTSASITAKQAYIKKEIPGLTWRSCNTSKSHYLCGRNANWSVAVGTFGLSVDALHIDTLRAALLSFEGDELVFIIDHFAGFNAAKWMSAKVTAANFGTFHKRFGSWTEQLTLTVAGKGTIEVVLVS